MVTSSSRTVKPDRFSNFINTMSVIDEWSTIAHQKNLSGTIINIYTRAAEQLQKEILTVKNPGEYMRRFSQLWVQMTDLVTRAGTEIDKGAAKSYTKTADFLNHIVPDYVDDQSWHRIGLSAQELSTLLRYNTLAGDSLTAAEFLGQSFQNFGQEYGEIVGGYYLQGVGPAKTARRILQQEMIAPFAYNPEGKLYTLHQLTQILAQADGLQAMRDVFWPIADLKTRHMQRDIETVASTWMAHAATKARHDFYDANKGVIKEYEWSATLENANVSKGRGTCPRCQGLDGQRYDEIKDAPPIPLHPRCRCIMVPITRGITLRDKDGNVIVTPEQWEEWEEGARHEVRAKYGYDAAQKRMADKDSRIASIRWINEHEPGQDFPGAMVAPPDRAKFPNEIIERMQVKGDYEDFYRDQLSKADKLHALGPTRTAYIMQGGSFDKLVVGDRRYLDYLSARTDHPYKLGDLVLIDHLPKPTGQPVIPPPKPPIPSVIIKPKPSKIMLDNYGTGDQMRRFVERMEYGQKELGLSRAEAIRRAAQPQHGPDFEELWRNHVYYDGTATRQETIARHMEYIRSAYRYAPDDFMRETDRINWRPRPGTSGNATKDLRLIRFGLGTDKSKEDSSIWTPESIAAHELGHFLEYHHYDVPSIEFSLDRRKRKQVFDDALVYASTDYPIKAYFPDKYAGRLYRIRGADGYRASEVISAGLENIVSYPEKIHDIDPEWFGLVLDLMQGEYKLERKI